MECIPGVLQLPWAPPRGVARVPLLSIYPDPLPRFGLGGGGVMDQHRVPSQVTCLASPSSSRQASWSQDRWGNSLSKSYRLMPSLSF